MKIASIAVRREIYDTTLDLFGNRDHSTYVAALRLAEVLLEQYYVRDAQHLLQILVDEQPEVKQMPIQFLITYFRTNWMMHFYGEKDYRDKLRIAVKGFLLIFRLVTEDALKQREVIVALHRALSHQLDWSLDDLELDFIDRQVVDLVLADLPRLAGAGF